jgi:hypothetical protein
MSQINPGDTVRLTAEFRNSAGTLTNPTAVTLRIRPKGGTPVVYVYGVGVEVVRDSTGLYHMDYTVPNLGRFVAFDYRWEGTGTVAAVEEGQFLAATDWPA